VAVHSGLQLNSGRY